MVETEIVFRRCFKCPGDCKLNDFRNWLEAELNTDLKMGKLREKVFEKDIKENYGISFSHPSIVDFGAEEISELEKDGKIIRKRTEIEELRWKCHGWEMGSLRHEWPNLISGFIRVSKRSDVFSR